MSTALITVRPRETVAHSDLDMRLAGIRHLPVVDDRNHLVGVVSDRDLLAALGRSARSEVSVQQVMTTDVQTVNESTPADRALETMLELKIGCLPVVADDGHLVGVITETDFLQLAHRALMGQNLGRA